MDDPRTFDRHIDTLAAMNVVAGAATVGLAAWLIGGLHASVNREERQLRLWGAALLIALAALFVILWLAMQLRMRGAPLFQLAAAGLLLPLVPVGTVWGGYALWLLTKRGARSRFEHGATPPVGVRPYPGLLSVAVLTAVLVIAVAPVVGRQAWLAAQVADLSRAAAAHGEAISDQSARLRAAGLIDGENSERRGKQ